MQRSESLTSNLRRVPSEFSYSATSSIEQSVSALNLNDSAMNKKSCPRSPIDLERFIQSRVNPKQYNCEYCNQTFFQLCNLKRHEKIHTGERPYYCALCKRGFTTFSNLKQHQQTHENSNDRAKFSCKYCSRTYYYQNSLKKHLKVHKNQSKTKKDTLIKEDHSTHEYEPAISKHLHLEQELQHDELRRSPGINASYRQNDSNYQGTQALDLSLNLIIDQNNIKTDSAIQPVSLALSLLFDKLKLLKELYQIKVSQYQELKQCRINQERSFDSSSKDKEEDLMTSLLEIASRMSEIKDEANQQKTNQKMIDVLGSIGNVNLPYQLFTSQFQPLNHVTPLPLQTSYSLDNSMINEESSVGTNTLIRESAEESDSLACEFVNPKSGEDLTFVKESSNSTHLSNQTKPVMTQDLESLLMNSTKCENNVGIVSNCQQPNCQQEVEVENFSNESPFDVELFKDLFSDQNLLPQTDQDFLPDCSGF